MRKINPKELSFPSWSEVSNYGIITLRAGDTVKAHFHDCNEFWLIVQGKGIATSESLTYDVGPGDMLITKAGEKHGLIVTEEMVAIRLYGVMPPGGRFRHLYRGVDPDFAEWQEQKKNGFAKHADAV